MRAAEPAAVATFFLLVLLPLIFMLVIPAPVFSLAPIPVALIVLYSSARLAVISASRRPQIVLATFWVFVYIFLAVSPLLQITSNSFPWRSAPEDDLLTEAALIVLLGLIAFDVGNRFIRRTRTIGVPSFLQRPLSRPAIWVLSVTSLVGSFFMVQMMGGLDVLLSTRLERMQSLSSEFDSPQIALVNNLATTPVYVLLIAMLAVWAVRYRRRQRAGLAWVAMIIVLLVATLLLNNPIGTPRLKVGTILLSLFFLLPWRRWSNAATVIGLVAGLILIFPFMDLFRNSLDASLSARVGDTSVIRELTQKGDFDAFLMIANTVAVTEKTGIQFGHQIGGAILFWVPRTAWLEKPISTGQWVAENVGYSFTNLSSPLWAEFYVDGGWLLVILGFIGYGRLVRTLDQWYETSDGSAEVKVVSVLVPIYAGYQIFLLRGSLMPAIAYFSPMLLIAALCSVSFRKQQLKRPNGLAL